MTYACAWIQITGTATVLYISLFDGAAPFQAVLHPIFSFSGETVLASSLAMVWFHCSRSDNDRLTIEVLRC